MMNRGICFMLPDGTEAMLPLHIFRCGKDTIIRIGDNVLNFTEDGRFDGEECHVDDLPPNDPMVQVLMEALEQSEMNSGLPPETFYYPEGTPGRDAEERSMLALSGAITRNGREVMN